MAESIERGGHFETPSQETTARPGHDSLAGNIRKILVALDIGSGNIKAAWKPVYDRREQHALVDRLRHGCRPVVWNNLQAHCPAQVAYRVIDGDDGRLHLQKFWGCDVDDALDRGDLVERDVLKWVKPVIFNYEEKASLKFHKGQLKRHLGRLKMMAEENGVPENEWKEIDEVSIYSDLMGFAFEFVCGKIREEFPRLRLNLNSRIQNMLSVVDVEVALPVPASSLPKHIKMVLEAAKRASLPNPFPVAEPTAAVVYYLQEQMETSTDQAPVDGQTVLLLDAGEGSLDATLCSVIPRIDIDFATETSPTTDSMSSQLPKDRYVLQEEIAGLTEWAGGSFANQACQEWLERTFDAEFDVMLRHPVHKERYKTKSNIVAELIRDFERRKKRFSGFSSSYGDEVRLTLHGFPPSRVNGNNGGYIMVTKSVMMDFFKRQVDASVVLIDQQIERLQTKNRALGALHSVDQIILVGGANESKYVREAIKEHAVRSGGLDFHGRIDIKLPQVERLSTLTAQGALLLLQDKNFIGERILRRGYCVKWDKPTLLRKSTKDYLIEKDREDGVMCMKDVSKFLLRAGDRIAHQHQVSMRNGWRALCMEPEINDTGFDYAADCFLIDEAFFFCDKQSIDDLYVHHKQNGFHEVGVVTFRLDRELCHNFVETYEHEGRTYWRIQYEVKIEVVGLDFRYKMIIPETGVFEGDRPNDYGQNPIIAEGLLTWENEGGLCII